MNEDRAIRQILTPRERRDYGVTVTVDMDGERLVFCEYGSSRVALTTLLERLDAMGKPYRVVTISTPQTIYGDLYGRRNQKVQGQDIGVAQMPEGHLLSSIGRMDVAPLAISDAAKQKRARRSGVRTVCSDPGCLEWAAPGWQQCKYHTNQTKRRGMGKWST